MMAERNATIAYLRGRAATAREYGANGRLNASEANRLSRWLGIIAEEIEAGLHIVDPAP